MVYPTIYWVSTIHGGAGFLPSTVSMGLYIYVYISANQLRVFLIMGLSTIIDDVPFLADVPHFTPIIMRMDHLFKCSIVNEDELPTEII